MTNTRVHISSIEFKSPSKEAIELKLQNGLNVIYGASDTGKTFILDTIDFMLGASKKLKDFDERVGYDQISMKVTTSDGNSLDIKRSVNGGGYLIEKNNEKPIKLGKKHSSKSLTNLSAYLLSVINLYNQKIRTNASGDTQGVSFRDLAYLILIKINMIIKEESPVLSGQFVRSTLEQSLFKLLLTGMDDSAFVGTKKSKQNAFDLQIIEQLIKEYEEALKDPETADEYSRQVESIDAAVNQEKENAKLLSIDIENSLKERSELTDRREIVASRMGEITALLERFELLDKHYSNDLKRLEGIKESGLFLSFLNSGDCPLCGAVKSNQDHSKVCDGDIQTMLEACSAEIMKVLRLKNELRITVNDLSDEYKIMESDFRQIQGKFEVANQKVIDQLSPKLSKSQEHFSILIKKQFELKRNKEIAEKIATLRDKKTALTSTVKVDNQNIENGILPKSTLGELCRIIEKLLKEWHFPNVGAVYFDEPSFDIVISDKPRGSQGTGLRAITHAAFSIALMEYCIEKDLPHPGFIVLDSPLLAYKEPDPATGVKEDNDNVENTDLKDRFYFYLANVQQKYQVIILENSEPPANLNANVIHFTKNRNQGRYGLFPVSDEVN